MLTRRLTALREVARQRSDVCLCEGLGAPAMPDSRIMSALAAALDGAVDRRALHFCDRAQVARRRLARIRAGPREAEIENQCELLMLEMALSEYLLQHHADYGSIDFRQ